MLPRALLLFAVLVWGWTFVATKILVAELEPIEVFALRLAIGFPVLGGVLLAKRVPLSFGREDWRPVLVGSAIFTTHFLVQIAGLETTTATNTGWIISATPLVLALLSYVLLGERIGRLAVAGIFVATAGIVLLVSRGGGTHAQRGSADLSWLESSGDWLVLGSVFTWAFYTVATRDLVRRRDPLAVTFVILVPTALIMVVLFAATGELSSIRALSTRAWIAALFLGIPGLALAHWFWQEGVAKLGAARAGLYLYLEPLSTVALAVPLLGEPFGPLTAMGGALVLLGVFVGQRDGRSP